MNQNRRRAFAGPGADAVRAAGPSGRAGTTRFQAAGEDFADHATICSQVRPWDALELAPGLRDIGPVMRPAGAAPVMAAPGHVKADARPGACMSKNIELSLRGSNLLHARHIEVNEPSAAPSRTLSGSVDLKAVF
ncbi:MAG: hypothetical protein WDM92_13985 [Caulobacteraceae bacterium]